MNGRRVAGGAVLGAVTVLGLLVTPASADHPTGALTPYEWACPAGTVPEDGFVDVPASNPHEEAIDCAVAQGLTRGTGPRTYSPLTHVTRAQLATFVSLLPDGDPETYRPPPDAFDDDNGSVHEGAINTLAAEGVVLGTGPRQFSPHALVTRAQMAAYLVRATERALNLRLPQARNHFGDDDGTTHEPSINRAASLGLTTGVRPGAYEPAGAVRRDQMARFLTRTWGCSRFQPRDGQHHDPRCDRYPDTEGMQALQGFDVAVGVSRHQLMGQPVAVDVQACNRRSTVLRQTFPQKDWFVLEARHQQLGAVMDSRNPGASDVPWYDHRVPGSLAGSGYAPYRHRTHQGEVVLDRNPDPITTRLGRGRPRVQAITWFDGPQTSAEQEVVWQPGECKALDAGAWGQGKAGYAEGVSPYDHPAIWRHVPGNPQARAVPGWYALRLHWGGVEVGQTRRYLSVDSAQTHLDGPRISVTRDKTRYAPDEPVVITVQACNDGEQPYREEVGRADSVGESLFTVTVDGNLHGRQEVARVTPQENALTWAPGECRSWNVTWDQRFGGQPPAQQEMVSFQVDWNDASEGRVQDVRGEYASLR